MALDVNQAGEEPGSAAAAPVKIFINYRHADTAHAALHLYESLSARFEADSVFLDHKSIGGGLRWLEQLREHGTRCGAFLALIGPRWATSFRPDGEEDWVRDEIVEALKVARTTKTLAPIPVLVDMPTRPSDVPPHVEPLFGYQAKPLRVGEFERDVDELARTIRERMSEVPTVRLDERPPPPPPPPSPESPFDEVVAAIVDGDVVPFLGPEANSSDREEAWSEVGCGYLPDAAELAAYLAKTLPLEPGDLDLAEVSQLTWVKEGERLYQRLKSTLGSPCPPTSVHRFLARLPVLLEQRGLKRRPQLIVTTNYDNALEQAFREAHEPFDLFVYRPRDGGRFVHISSSGAEQPIPIGAANLYTGFPNTSFPISSTGEVTQTVIVKIHGAVDGDNYVITEDHYIDYLSSSSVSDIVPAPILTKLQYGRFLFLGYTMRDWNLRVFLHRVLGQRELNPSWAVQRALPDRLDARFWQRIGAECVAMPLSDYVRGLELALPTPSAVSA